MRAGCSARAARSRSALSRPAGLRISGPHALRASATVCSRWGEAAAVVGEQGGPVRRPHQQVLQYHVVGEEDVGRVAPQRLTLGLLRQAVIAGHSHVGVAGLLQVLADARLLIVGQRVHRVDEEGGQPVALEAAGILDGVLDDGEQEALRLSGACARGDHERGGRGREQVGDGLALVEPGPLGAGAPLHDGGQPRIQPELPPRCALLEGAVGLEEGLLGEEEGPLERLLEVRAELGAPRAELGEEVAAVLSDDLIDDGDGVERHGRIQESWAQQGSCVPSARPLFFHTMGVEVL